MDAALKLEVLFTSDQIGARVRELAAEIRAAMRLENAIAVVVLRGAVPFSVDLLRALDADLPVAYAHASSYRDGMERGPLRAEIIGSPHLSGRDILLIEDIVDTGHTVRALRHELRAARSVHVATLLDKPGKREVEEHPDFAGFIVAPDQFVVGYGLDYDERFRSLPYLATFSETTLSGEASAP